MTSRPTENYADQRMHTIIDGDLSGWHPNPHFPGRVWCKKSEYISWTMVECGLFQRWTFRRRSTDALTAELLHPISIVICNIQLHQSFPDDAIFELSQNQARSHRPRTTSQPQAYSLGSMVSRFGGVLLEGHITCELIELLVFQTRSMIIWLFSIQNVIWLNAEKAQYRKNFHHRCCTRWQFFCRATKGRRDHNPNAILLLNLVRSTIVSLFQ